MAGGTDLVGLRESLQGLAGHIKAMFTHAELSAVCEQLGMPAPPDEGTKYERVCASLAAVPDNDLVRVAQRMLAELSLEPRTRNAIQDLLWAGDSIRIPKRTRREIARALDLSDLVPSRDRFMALLERLWVLDDGLLAFLDERHSLRARIDRHVFRNPGDWSTEELFEQLGAFDASDTRFVLFLEGVTSAEVVPDEPTQRAIVEVVNPHLRTVGAELRETDTEDGYPVFRVVSTHMRSDRRPKNLIFASPIKPDIRLVDAIDNDIEIVGQADQVLVYDRPIGPDGIRWRDLQAWWKDTRGLGTDAEAKATLYERLLRSLPETSPPQQRLYRLYHAIFGPAVPDLPALLPEVWLHWDPKTVRMRGAEALLRFRMDFLLLLPRGQRVVLEVDGEHHYASNGRPDPRAYANTMRGDRDLKLAGYEVFRFGTHDLEEQRAERLLRTFFTDLYRCYQVPIPPAH